MRCCSIWLDESNEVIWCCSIWLDEANEVTWCCSIWLDRSSICILSALISCSYQTPGGLSSLCLCERLCLNCNQKPCLYCPICARLFYLHVGSSPLQYNNVSVLHICLYAFMVVHMNVCMYVEGIHVSFYICRFVCVYVFVYVYMYVHVYVCVYVCIYIYVWVYVCIYAFM